MHIQTKVPEALGKYIEEIVKKGYAKNTSEAVKLIITERMMTDGGEVRPFKYSPISEKKSKRTLRVEIIGNENVRGASPPLHPPELKEGNIPAPTEEYVDPFTKINKPSMEGWTEEEKAAFEKQFGKM